MVTFKIGDLVRHKNDGELLRIKSINGTTVSCEEIYKEKEINAYGVFVYPVRVSLMHNLILNKKICWKCGQLYIEFNKHPHKK